jgi:hypothetical protein
MPVVPTLDWLRQEDHEIKANLGYIERSCLTKQEQAKNVKHYYVMH